MKKAINTSSEKETKDFAKVFAKNLKGGEVVGLIGNLGAGKTTFTKALAKAIGVKQTVTSPTFVLMKVYNAKKGKIKHLCHVDAYRIDSKNDLEAIGALEYFNRDDTVNIIEWADQVKDVLPKKTKYIKIDQGNKNKRIINLF